MKPNNVFLNWRVDSDDVFHLDKVALGDMDCALHLKGDRPLNAMMGNVIWRSPEGQVGRGIHKPSEVFAFGLMVRILSSTQYQLYLLTNLYSVCS